MTNYCRLRWIRIVSNGCFIITFYFRFFLGIPYRYCFVRKAILGAITRVVFLTACQYQNCQG